MTEPRRARTVAALGAVAFAVGGLVAEWIATDGRLATDPRIALDAVVDLVAGWILAGAGLAAWLAAPRSRVGPLLLLSATGWFIGTVAAPTTSVGQSDLGWLAGFLWQLHAGFLVHAIVTAPTGRISRRTQLPLVVGGYVAALFPQLWTDSPAYVVLGALLAVGILADLATLPAARRAAYRAERDAGLLLAAVLAGAPAIARALDDLGMTQLGRPANLYAVAVAACALIVARSLVRRVGGGAAADLAVELRAGAAADPGPDEALARLAREVAADGSGDDDLRRAVARAGELLERNRALRATLDEQVHQLDASRRRLVEVGDEERRALLDRLRSGAGTHLEDLTGSVRALAAAPLPEGVAPRLARAADLLAHAQADLDAVAAGLDPGRVAERGLDAALRDLAAASPVPVALSLPGAAPDRPPLTVATTLYYVASEALANVVRHARAGAAWLRLGPEGGRWLLVVEDDGVGGADPGRGTGLRGLRERVEVLGGGLVVEARAEGGTRLSATVPDPSGIVRG